MLYFNLGCCIICGRIIHKDHLKLHYNFHTREEMIKELMSVSDSLAKYGKYA